MVEIKIRTNINQTGLRLLYLLKQLLKRPLNKDEIIELIDSQSYLYPIRKDTITIDMNTMREAGIKITDPTKATAYKYVIQKHPFGLRFSEEELKDLATLKSIVLKVFDWRYILELYKLFSALSQYVPQEIKEEFLDFKYFNLIDLNIFEQLERCCNLKLEVALLYDSQNTSEKEIKLIADKIKYDNGKLYLWGYNKDYKDEMFLRIGRIKKINSISIESKYNEIPVIRGKYKIWGETAMNFAPDEDETIIEKGEDFVIVEAFVRNEFYFMQKILSYGTDCKLLEPGEYKAKLLKLLKEIYEAQ